MNQSPIAEDIRQIGYYHSKLGINDYTREYSLVAYSEADNLQKFYSDVVPKGLYLAPSALRAVKAMQQAASEDQVKLLIYSGFRSYQYQYDLIKLRLDRGEKLAEILAMLAAPGYSEHHTGLAVDITTTDCPPGSVEFESTKAFKWLTENAEGYGFSLTYGKDNPYNITYEPWHWSLK